MAKRTRGRPKEERFLPAPGGTCMRPQRSEVGGMWSGRGTPLSTAVFHSILSWNRLSQELPPSRRARTLHGRRRLACLGQDVVGGRGIYLPKMRLARPRGPRSLIPTPKCQQGERSQWSRDAFRERQTLQDTHSSTARPVHSRAASQWSWLGRRESDFFSQER